MSLEKQETARWSRLDFDTSPATPPTPPREGTAKSARGNEKGNRGKDTPGSGLHVDNLRGVDEGRSGQGEIDEGVGVVEGARYQTGGKDNASHESELVRMARRIKGSTNGANSARCIYEIGFQSGQCEEYYVTHRVGENL